MAVYKDVEPFIKWLEQEIKQFGEPNISIRPVAYGSENALRSVLNKMKELPTADVEEMVHARWEINSDGYSPYCSHCKTEPKNGVMSKRCPECGAKMDGKRK